MDSSRFDDLTKALANATSRRQALKTFAATTLGGILGLAGISSAFADPTCKPNGHGCGTNKQCCSGFCDHTTNICVACPPGTVQLSNGTCAIDCLTSTCPNQASGVCFCATDTDGINVYCATITAGSGNCTIDRDCPRGQFCHPTNFCTPICPA